MSQATADLLYTPATSKSTISLPKAQWKSKTRNLLPDDKHFNSKQLLRLFLKPKARMGSRVEGRRVQPLPEKEPAEDVDEAYWANRNDAPGQDEGVNYDANFFQDDPLPHPGGPIDDDIDEDIDEDGGFADARDHFSPVPQDGVPPSSQPLDGALLPSSQASDAYGAELVTLNRRFRPEYVQYARVAKKVDVKRLKDNLWKGTGWEEVRPHSVPHPHISLTY
jgi:condensin complex subunit 2